MILGFSSLLNETLNRGPMTIFQDKLPTRTHCGEARDYAVPNVFSPKDLVFRPDLSDKKTTIIFIASGLTKWISCLVSFEPVLIGLASDSDCSSDTDTASKTEGL